MVHSKVGEANIISPEICTLSEIKNNINERSETKRKVIRCLACVGPSDNLHVVPANQTWDFAEDYQKERSYRSWIYIRLVIRPVGPRRSKNGARYCREIRLSISQLARPKRTTESANSCLIPMLSYILLFSRSCYSILRVLHINLVVFAPSIIGVSLT